MAGVALARGPLLLSICGMDRSAIFVDAGYLYAAGGELCRGERYRQWLELG